MFCISLSYKNADVKTLEKVSLCADDLRDIKIGVVIRTCNRIELYACDNLYFFIDKYFSLVKSKILVYENEKAIRHLFNVACGLDSMSLGEDEILGQVKEAFSYSLKNSYTNYELNTVFKSAITCAKKIKTDTLLSKTSVSVATIAANYCRRFKKGKKSVLVIGASGDTGNKVIKNLISYGDFDICATVREHKLKDSVKTVDYKDRYKYINSSDIVISATKSPHFTVTVDKIKGLDNKNILYIDLAVPRDIDPEIENVITIDELKDIAKKNSSVKQSEVDSARDIIDDSLDELLKELSFHSMLPLNMSDEMKHFVYNFRDVSNAEEFSSFCAVLKRMEEKS